jgi:hypothetical protein
VRPPPLAVLGLVLNPDLAKRSMEGSVGWEGTFDEEQRAAAALGYVAHLVDRIAIYCDVGVLLHRKVDTPCPL